MSGRDDGAEPPVVGEDPTDDELVPHVITCIDCGGRCHLLTNVSVDQPLVPGDVATYRCEDCLDRWDLIVPGADDDTGFDLDPGNGERDADRYQDRFDDR